VVLTVAGDHVPVMPFIDVPGRTGAALFLQRGPIWVNAGVSELVIWISIVAVEAH
jgi:hypothetical protein